ERAERETADDDSAVTPVARFAAFPTSVELGKRPCRVLCPVVPADVHEIANVVRMTRKPRSACAKPESRRHLGHDRNFAGRTRKTVKREHGPPVDVPLDRDGGRVSLPHEPAVGAFVEREDPTRERLNAIAGRHLNARIMTLGTSVMIASTPIAASARASSTSL